jgi:hypothetical protein
MFIMKLNFLKKSNIEHSFFRIGFKGDLWSWTPMGSANIGDPLCLDHTGQPIFDILTIGKDMPLLDQAYVQEHQLHQ